MKSLILRAAMLGLALALAAAPADAQRRVRRAAAVAERPGFGAHLGYNFDFEDLLLGVQANVPITPRVMIYPSFDLYLPDAGSLWALNADIKFRPPTRSGFLYVGGGLNILHLSQGGLGNTDTNLNILAGLEGRRWRHAVPYLETKLIIGDGSAFQVVGGFSWH